MLPCYDLTWNDITIVPAINTPPIILVLPLENLDPIIWEVVWVLQLFKHLLNCPVEYTVLGLVHPELYEPHMAGH